MLSERLIRWSKLLARFLSLEVFVQALGFAAGIFLVRLLSKTEYAYFTVASAMQGTMNMLCDNGVGSGISGIGGAVWHDRFRFGQLINTAMRMRRKLAIAATLVVTPVLFALLLQKDCTVSHASLITAAVLLGLYFQITIGVLVHVPLLNLQWKRLQNMNIWSSALRLALLATAYLTVLDAATAVLATTVAVAAVHFYLHRWMPEMIDTHAPENAEDRKKIVSLIKTQAPNAIFFCFQSQITIWLISIFGDPTSLADVGALGRLTAIFSVVGSVMGNLVVPRFVRCQDATKLWGKYGQIMGAYCGFGTLIILAAVVVPTPMLWVLGDKYARLEPKLLLLVTSSVLWAIQTMMWNINSSRAWMMPPWLSIPVNLITQIVLVLVLDVTQVDNILLMGILSILPSLALNLWVTARGIKQFRDHPPAAPAAGADAPASAAP